MSLYHVNIITYQTPSASGTFPKKGLKYYPPHPLSQREGRNSIQCIFLKLDKSPKSCIIYTSCQQSTQTPARCSLKTFGRLFVFQLDQGDCMEKIFPPIRAFALGLLAALALMTGCAMQTTTTRYPDGREVTTTSYGGSAQCVKSTVGWTVVGGLLGAAVADTSKGAGRGAALGALFGSQRECQESLRGVGGGQRAEHHTMEKVDRISTEECARKGRAVSGGQCLPAGSPPSTVDSRPSGVGSTGSQIWDPVDGRCVRGLTLEGSDGRVQKCAAASTFLNSGSRACLWQDRGINTLRLRGDYAEPASWQRVSIPQGQRLGPCPSGMS